MKKVVPVNQLENELINHLEAGWSLAIAASKCGWSDFKARSLAKKSKRLRDAIKKQKENKFKY